jgi:N-carbamoyl-L-amino-acid hydrolase
VDAFLDARGPEEAEVRALVDEVGDLVIAARGTIAEESWTPSTRFDPALLNRLGRTLPDAPLLGTGAGHDAGILAAAGIAAAMILVRNPTGVSHSPVEYAEREDCLAGVGALTSVLADLAGKPS